MARLFLALTRTRLTVLGLEHLPSGRACVLAANHASFLDGIIMVAALPVPMQFIAKRELRDRFVPRVYLTRIGTAFVERFDTQRGIEDTERFVETVRAGGSLIVFPEATFRRLPGLLPFRMGAFVIAAQAGVPVVPVTLHGTRSILREGQWLFRRGRIGVTLSPSSPRGRTGTPRSAFAIGRGPKSCGCAGSRTSARKPHSARSGTDPPTRCSAGPSERRLCCT